MPAIIELLPAAPNTILEMFKLYRPKTIAQAVRKILPGERARLSPQGGTELIEQVANRTCYPPLVLLAEVAAVLGIPFRADIATPSSELIARTGFQLDVLLRQKAVPQLSNRAPGFALAVSSLSWSTSRCVKAAPIEVALALPSQIDRALMTYQAQQSRTALQVPLPALLRRITEIVEHLASIGAKEAFIGVEGADVISSSVGGSAARFSLPSGSSSALAEILREGSFELQPNSDSLRSLRFSLSHRLLAEQIHLTWKERSCSKREVLIATEDERAALQLCYTLETRGAKVAFIQSVQTGRFDFSALALLIVDEEYRTLLPFLEELPTEKVLLAAPSLPSTAGATWKRIAPDNLSAIASAFESASC